MSVRVRDIELALATRFPPERAEGWDRVGLLAGDPERVVTGVMLALDPTREAIRSAVRSGANVLVTHHPAFLEMPASLSPGPGPSGVLFSALDASVALINAHTNLDRDAEAQRLLPEMLGLHPLSPLERGLQSMSVVTVYAPVGAESAITGAMIGAGAGRIGDYEGCSFASRGSGSFTPSPSSHPAVGEPGAPSTADEVRIEMVCPRGSSKAVVAAAVSAHPYEEPLVTVSEVSIALNAASIGMVNEVALGSSLTLERLARVAAERFGAMPRVWGDPESLVSRVVTSTGSAGSFIPDALRAGAAALVAGEVRYHDALDAVENGLAIVELGHDVSEWPLVALLERAVRSVAGIDQESVRTLPARPGWWVPAPEGNR
ncbi:MAG TPA: Nif3-like dinuclear metal center hexameric protein [Coriobacteriia bacterium]|nr:Nif3-like dinuclear metal center hexameric protein [Coriobacteriia bacterium]